MKVYIKDINKTATVRIYGITGKECTKEFFSVFFIRAIEIHQTTDEERTSGTDGEFTFDTYELFREFAGKVGIIQSVLDDVSEMMIEGSVHEDWLIDNSYFVM